MKTSTVVGESRKIFINICADPQIPPPDILDIAEITRCVQTNRDWIVPIAVSPQRDVVDKKGNPAIVFDCCMNPKVLLLGVEDPGVKILVNETSIELVEDASGFMLDRNYSLPKMKAKGELMRQKIDTADLFKGPKPVEEMLTLKQEPKSNPIQQKEQTQVAPVIAEVSESATPYYLHPYRRPWSGEGPKPDFEIELGQSVKQVSFEGSTVRVSGVSVNVQHTISKLDPIYTTDDETLHIFVWTKSG